MSGLVLGLITQLAQLKLDQTIEEGTKPQVLFHKKIPIQNFIIRTLASVVVSGLVLGLITLQAGNADDYIAAAMTIDYAATHIGLENRKFSKNKLLAALFLCFQNTRYCIRSCKSYNYIKS